MSLEDVTGRAKDCAVNVSDSVNTGYLLWAVFTGGGVASNILKTRGMNENKIRKQLRLSRDEKFVETETLYNKVIASALKVASSVRTRSVSAVHLLAAFASVRESLACQIMLAEGIDVDTVRVQALRNMVTGFTREHGRTQDQVSDSKNNLQDSRTGIRVTNKNKTAADKRPGSEKRPVRRGISLPQGNVGRRLEQAQQKARQARIKDTGSKPDDLKDVVAVGPSPQFHMEDFPTIAALGRDLVSEVQHGEIKPVVGRVAEIEQMADVLEKKRANCPCLVGPSGVGKTAIVEGLSFDLASGSLGGIHYAAVVEVNVGHLLGDTTLRGELGEKINRIVKEVGQSDEQIVLFFDDVHTLLDCNDAKEAVVELQAAMERGYLPCIWATSQEQYDRLIAESDFGRLVTQIEVLEPNEEDAKEILAGVAPDYEDHHGVEMTPEAIRAAVTLSHRYLADSYLPDKAISIIDLAGAQVKRRNGQTVEVEDVARVLAKRIGVPAERLVASDGERLLNIESELKNKIIGHSHVLEAVGETLRRNAAGFRNDRPIGSFLFLGPTGVGKTETAKALAEHLFADEKAMIRFDMSEFSQPHALARLIGAPPGYVGHEEGGQLTDAVRKRPYSLVLLDEIEKAHRDVIMSLLQVLDDGRLTDGMGKTVDFKNTVIIMTSNLGSDLREAMPKRKVGFGGGRTEADASDLEQAIFTSARGQLAPELWNRIDEPLVFKPLLREEVGEIARLMLRGLQKQMLESRGIKLLSEDSVYNYLVENGGYDAQLGARPMRRCVARLIEGPVARIVLQDDGDKRPIIVAVGSDGLLFEREI